MDMNLSLIVSLINNTQAGARKVKDTLKEFKQGFGDAVMPEFTAEQFDRNIDRLDGRINQARGKLLGAAAMLGTVFAPLKKSMDFEDAFIDFANVAEIPIDRMGEIEQKLIAQTKATGKNKTELLTILATLVGKGMGLDEAMASVEATGRASTAEKAGGEAMANSGFAVMDNLNVLPEQLQKAFDIMTSSGKEGSFELADMARKFPEITANAQSLKMVGLDAVASLSAALQIAMKSAGSADQAATNTANFMGKITAPDTVKKFAKMGVDIERVLKDAAEDGADPLLTALQTIEKITGGDQFKMGELFQDKQVLDFLRALIPNLEEFERIRDKARAAEGIIDKDFENVSKGLRTSFKGAANAIDSLFSSSSALLPVTKELVGLFTESVYAINDWTSANPELTATIVKVAAGLLLFGAGARVVSFAYAVIARGLFGLIGLFMRFNKAGKNISIVAKAFRGLGFVIGAIKPLKWAALIPRLVLSTFVSPLRWLGIIPVLKWATFIPRLMLGKFITSFKWLGLIPKLSWSALIPVLRWGVRFIPYIGWTVLAGELAWNLLIKPLKWDRFLNLGYLKQKLDQAKMWLADLLNIELRDMSGLSPSERRREARTGYSRRGRSDENVPATDSEKRPQKKLSGAAGRRQTRGRAAIPPIYKPEEQGRSKDRVQQQIDAQIKASVVDKRPPNINVTAPITINEAASPAATAAAIRGQLGSAVAGAKGGALHDGVDD